MSLRPCPSCRRHVAAVERGCPFCGAATLASAVPSILPAKLTRAAIFASAALGVPACWTGKSPETPADTTHHHAGSDMIVPADQSMGTIVVTIVDNKGNPVAGRQVRLDDDRSSLATDPGGKATFTKVPAGTHRVESHDGHPRHSPSVATVVVKAGEIAASTLTVYIQPYSATPMPYGAPPSRRRVV